MLCNVPSTVQAIPPIITSPQHYTLSCSIPILRANPQNIFVESGFIADQLKGQERILQMRYLHVSAALLWLISKIVIYDNKLLHLLTEKNALVRDFFHATCLA